MDKLPQLAPKPLAESHHRQAAHALVTLYHDAHDGIRRVVALGLFCLEVKTRLPHGQFRDWLQQWVSPIDSRIKLASLDAYMGITKNVLTECGFQISSALEICD